MTIHSTRKSTKRLRDVLDQLFGYLDQSTKSKNEEVKKKRSQIKYLSVVFFSS